jgi:hypothetical protein
MIYLLINHKILFIKLIYLLITSNHKILSYDGYYKIINSANIKKLSQYWKN